MTTRTPDYVYETTISAALGWPLFGETLRGRLCDVAERAARAAGVIDAEKHPECIVGGSGEVFRVEVFRAPVDAKAERV